jgi:hypothetical protein
MGPDRSCRSRQSRPQYYIVNQTPFSRPMFYHLWRLGIIIIQERRRCRACRQNQNKLALRTIADVTAFVGWHRSRVEVFVDHQTRHVVVPFVNPGAYAAVVTIVAMGTRSRVRDSVTENILH